MTGSGAATATTLRVRPEWSRSNPNGQRRIVNGKLAEDRKGYSSAQVSAQKTGANLGHQPYKSLILLGRHPPDVRGLPNPCAFCAQRWDSPRLVWEKGGPAPRSVPGGSVPGSHYVIHPRMRFQRPASGGRFRSARQFRERNTKRWPACEAFVVAGDCSAECPRRSLGLPWRSWPGSRPAMLPARNGHSRSGLPPRSGWDHPIR